MALYMTCVYITNIQAFKDALFHHSLKEVSQASSSIKLVATTHCWTYAPGREGFWVKLEMKNTTSQAYCDQAFKDALFHHSLKEVSQASSSIKLVANHPIFPYPVFAIESALCPTENFVPYRHWDHCFHETFSLPQDTLKAVGHTKQFFLLTIIQAVQVSSCRNFL